MNTTKRFRKILAAGAFAATMLVAAPAVSNAAIPGPDQIQVDPCSVITHGCGPTQTPDDKTTPPDEPGLPGPDDFTSAAERSHRPDRSRGSGSGGLRCRRRLRHQRRGWRHRRDASLQR